MNRIISIIGLAAVAAFAAVTGLDSGRARAQSAGGAVRIVDFDFAPKTVTVAVGASVTWTNGGTARHTATADRGTFDSKALGPGGTFAFKFDAPGTYAYHCDIHPSMTGAVTVAGAAPAPAAGRDARAQRGGRGRAGAERGAHR